MLFLSEKNHLPNLNLKEENKIENITNKFSNYILSSKNTKNSSIKPLFKIKYKSSNNYTKEIYSPTNRNQNISFFLNSPRVLNSNKEEIIQEKGGYNNLNKLVLRRPINQKSNNIFYNNNFYSSNNINRMHINQQTGLNEDGKLNQIKSQKNDEIYNSNNYIKNKNMFGVNLTPKNSKRAFSEENLSNISKMNVFDIDISYKNIDNNKSKNSNLFKISKRKIIYNKPKILSVIQKENISNDLISKEEESMFLINNQNDNNKIKEKLYPITIILK